jgi:hypothetical protein
MMSREAKVQVKVDGTTRWAMYLEAFVEEVASHGSTTALCHLKKRTESFGATVKQRIICLCLYLSADYFLIYSLINHLIESTI